MTTIAIDKSLLEQILSVLRRTAYQRAIGDPAVGVLALELIKPVRAALAAQHKPLFAALIAQHEGLADELAAMDTQPSEPAWHDAPTEPGLWVVKTIVGPEAHNIEPHDINEVSVGEWFGPIQEDTK